MTIDFFFIKDILFMNSILILMFFKKAPQKTGVLIISLVKIFINEKKKKKKLVESSLSFDLKIDKLKTAIL